MAVAFCNRLCYNGYIQRGVGQTMQRPRVRYTNNLEDCSSGTPKGQFRAVELVLPESQWDAMSGCTTMHEYMHVLLRHVYEPQDTMYRKDMHYRYECELQAWVLALRCIKQEYVEYALPWAGKCLSTYCEESASKCIQRLQKYLKEGGTNMRPCTNCVKLTSDPGRLCRKCRRQKGGY